MRRILRLFRSISAARRLRSLGPSACVVLGYHDITAAAHVGEDLYSVTRENFNQQVCVLKKHFDVCLPDSLGRSSASGRPRAIITFDDGKINNFELAFQALRSLGATALFFVSTSLVGAPGFVDWDQLREMRRAGMAVGSHGRSHENFSLLTPAEVRTELSASKRMLDESLGQTTDCFAYPYGGRSKIKDDAIPALRDAGYRFAFLFGGGALPESYNPYQIPREMVVDVRGSTLLQQLVKVLG